MTTQTLTVCNGKVGTSGYCDKCGKKSITTSNTCNNLIPFEPTLPDIQYDMIDMKTYLKRLITLIIGISVLLGIPIYFDNWSFLILSIPASVIVASYLDNKES